MLSSRLEFMIYLAERQGILRKASLHKVQQWALAWLIVHEKNQENVNRFEQDKYSMWLHRPEVWEQNYGESAQTSEEEQGIPMTFDEVESFLQQLDKKKTIGNRELDRIQSL